MASSWYIRSAAAGTGSGADWTNAKTTIGAAITASAAGDTFYVSEDHAETSGSAITITFKGTQAATDKVYCVNHLGTVPPVAGDLRTTATVTQTGNFILTVQGTVEIYGVQFLGSTNNNANSMIAVANGTYRMVFRSCQILARGTGASASNGITIGATTTPADVTWENTVISFGDRAAQSIALTGKLTWRNTAAAAATWATMPTTLIVGHMANGQQETWLEGLDLSAFSNTIFGANSALDTGKSTVKNCKLHASVTVAAVPFSGQNPIIDTINSANSTNYNFARRGFMGDLTTETTVIRTGGATDGTQGVSWKIVTAASNVSYQFPFETPPIRIWNDITSGTIDLTIYGIAAAIPYNDELWAEAEVMGDSGSPICSVVTNKMTMLDTHAQWSTDSASTWGGSTAPFYTTLTLSPRQKGYIDIYIKAAKASLTVYIDPKPIITGGPLISKSSFGNNELFAGVARSRIGVGL